MALHRPFACLRVFLDVPRIDSMRRKLQKGFIFLQYLAVLAEF
jgi:hypothetical protein